MKAPCTPKPIAFVGVSCEEYARVPLLPEEAIEQAIREGRAAREAAESEACHKARLHLSRSRYTVVL